MDRNLPEPKRACKEKHQIDPAIVAEDDDDEAESRETEEKKRRPVAVIYSSSTSNKRGGGGGGGVVTCQAERCSADLTDAKRYHRRHKVCEVHSKAAFVVVAGLRQRFCQQCSRFHELLEFDEAKRSCRRRLAGHNERRRKNSSESQGESSSQCRQANQGGTIPINTGSPAYKHFQIR